MKLFFILLAIILVGCGKKADGYSADEDLLLKVYRSGIDEYGVICYSSIHTRQQISCVKVK